ncbi:MAG: 2-dehydro-3-deoxygalactonokinase [Gammaproteobacteria bacterium]|nr:2-dehydro-3-deoxygalactonokinase [Gammaproteobacteria bacterium]MCH9743746.1 2-dehydro-3-deoxygalactonokinase [Gammaproteobacteria bacterium]
MTQAAFIGVDWGTTNFRAFLLSETAEMLDSRSAAQGILSVVKGAFATTLKNQLADWLQQYPTIPVLMSGMVGSSSGWQEVPYQNCPVDPATLSEHLYALPKLDQHALYIVPGLQLDVAEGRADVMRGEETQLFGVMAQTAVSCCCLPGTHSKWVRLNDGKIEAFTTYMTGELFSLLTKHSILHKQIHASQFSESEFIRGLDVAQNDQGFLANCFNVRAQYLMKHLSSGHTEAFLSGLLIGNELLSAKPYWQQAEKIMVIASEQVLSRYRVACQHLAIDVAGMQAEKAVIHGLMMLAKQANLIE